MAESRVSIQSEKFSNEKKSTKKQYLELDSVSFFKDIDIKKIPNLGDNEGEIFDLSEGVVNLINLVNQNKATTLILLDKSARPVGHLFKNVWRELYQDKIMPDIRFINSGREDERKDLDSISLNELKRAHESSINGKVVIVADEFVSSGNSLKRTKNLIHKVFPQVKKMVFTGVTPHLPNWYGKSKMLGVYDPTDLPFLWDIPKDDKSKVLGRERATHISKSLMGVYTRNESLVNVGKNVQTDIMEAKLMAYQLRGELSYLAKKIAGSCMKREGIRPKPRLSNGINRDLNTKL